MLLICLSLDFEDVEKENISPIPIKLKRPVSHYISPPDNKPPTFLQMSASLPFQSSCKCVVEKFPMVLCKVIADERLAAILVYSLKDLSPS